MPAEIVNVIDIYYAVYRSVALSVLIFLLYNRFKRMLTSLNFFQWQQITRFIQFDKPPINARVTAHLGCSVNVTSLNHRGRFKNVLLLLVRLHDQSSSSDEVGGLLKVLQDPMSIKHVQCVWQLDGKCVINKIIIRLVCRDLCCCWYNIFDK